jgi:hypothetical protein
MRRPKTTTAVFLVSMMAARLLRAAIVFDSLPREDVGGGFGFVGNKEVGQAIELGVGGRVVTNFEVYLGTSDSENFRVRFYDLNASNEPPSDLIWETPVQMFQYIGPFLGRRVLTSTTRPKLQQHINQLN